MYLLDVYPRNKGTGSHKVLEDILFQLRMYSYYISYLHIKAAYKGNHFNTHNNNYPNVFMYNLLYLQVT